MCLRTSASHSCLPSAHFENTILITEGDPVMTTYFEGDL